MGQNSTAQAARCIARAIEAFARGFCFTRSFTHPYKAQRFGRVWVVRDAPRRDGKYRREEWIAHGVEAAEIRRVARQHTRGSFAICAIRGMGETTEPLREAFKRLGYRLNSTEAFMVHRLKAVPDFAPPVEILRVTTPQMAQRLSKATRRRPLADALLKNDSPMRQYAALDDGGAPIACRRCRMRRGWRMFM